MLYQEYKYLSELEKEDYFLRLTLAEKLELYNSMSFLEQQQLFFILPINEIKTFVLAQPVNQQFEFYNLLRKNSRLKEIYKIMSSDEREILQDSLSQKQEQIEQEKQDAMDKMTDANTSIVNNNNVIENSKQTIKNEKQNIRDQKKNLRSQKAVVKKSDKNRERQLKRVLKASKPRRLDCIGFIHRYHTKKLTEKVQEYQRLNEIYNQQVDKKQAIEDNITASKENIENKKELIKESENNIAMAKIQIHDSSNEIKNANATIRQLSKTERKTIILKLLNRQVKKENCVAIVPRATLDKIASDIDNKLDTEKENINVGDGDVINQPLSDESIIESGNKIINMFEYAGAEIETPEETISTQTNPDIIENPIDIVPTRESNVISYDIFKRKQQEREMQKQQESNLENGGRSYSKTLGAMDIKFIVVTVSLIGLLLGIIFTMIYH